ncbi:TlpA disulfide reductase family protein [Bordetella sp. N]|uniref:TlpA family protein disulfide reductase n=1 Tax=Bordetella sp. N TaxID=1746199 RepID=UPI00070B5C6A|nr:TlpA disulfide reductase family protein [Bordetella sp. N]ALM87126.1 thioredoxin [Bordetella sp. N]
MDRRTFLLRTLTLASTAWLARYMPVAFAADAGGATHDLLTRPFPDLNGASHKLGDWRGKPLLVNFWATWCAPCVKEMPALDALSKLHPQAQFVGIGVDTADNMRRFVAKVPVSYPLLVAGPGAIDLMRGMGNGPGGLPFSVLLDKDGAISHKVLGTVKEDDLSARLKALGA